jgi:hypothetical protein
MLQILKESLEINGVGGPQQIDELMSFNTQTGRLRDPLLLLVRLAPILNN